MKRLGNNFFYTSTFWYKSLIPALPQQLWDDHLLIDTSWENASNKSLTRICCPRFRDLGSVDKPGSALSRLPYSTLHEPSRAPTFATVPAGSFHGWHVLAWGESPDGTESGTGKGEEH